MFSAFGEGGSLYGVIGGVGEVVGGVFVVVEIDPSKVVRGVGEVVGGVFGVVEIDPSEVGEGSLDSVVRGVDGVIGGVFSAFGEGGSFLSSSPPNNLLNKLAPPTPAAIDPNNPNPPSD